MVNQLITPSILLLIKHSAIDSTSSLVKSGAILTANGTYLPCFSASTCCSALRAANSSFNASPYCSERKPGVLGDEILIVI